MRDVLIDASSAILLFKAGLFDFLAEGYRVNVAKTVFDEIAVSGYPGAEYFRGLFEVGSIRVLDKDDSRQPPTRAMGKGESETLRMYGRFADAFVIIDDKKGAAWCRGQGIPYINALLIPKILFYSKKVDEAFFREKMDFIARSGRYSGIILDYARTCSREDISNFLMDTDHDFSE